jgi:RNA polymerase sigma-70 factor (ECF subfamily)
MENNPNLSGKALYDYRLVISARKGNQKAYGELLKRYRDSIYFLVLRMSGNKSDAEDLTIETFGKAFKNIFQYEPYFSFRTWLIKIATNNAIDFLRKRQSDCQFITNSYDSKDTSGSLIIESSDLDPEEQLICSQKHNLMHSIVSKLKPHYRKIIELRYFNECSYDEICKEMDLPLGTVKAQLFRARELLYNILKNSDVKQE